MHKRLQRSAGGYEHSDGDSAKAGKRTRTQGIEPRGVAPVAPVQLRPAAEPAGEQPDPFDFSYVEEQDVDEAPEPPTTTPTKVNTKVKTNFGTFKATTYQPVTAMKQQVGAEIVLHFTPNKAVNAKKIAMVQIVRTVNEGKPWKSESETSESRKIKADDAEAYDSPVLGTDEGFEIDQDPHQENPLYAVNGAPKGGGLAGGKTPDPVRKATRAEKKKVKEDSGIEGATHAGAGGHGHRYKRSGTWKTQDATLHDVPRLQVHGDNAEQVFETTALAIEGKQTGKYYGSVQWGWRTDDDGKFELLPLKLISEGDPSETFVKAAKIWNRGKTAGGTPNIDLPIPGEDADDWQP